MSVFGERRPLIALAAVAFVVFNIGLAGMLVLAVYSFDPALLAERGSLIDRGGANPALLRLAALVDLVGYLAFAPVVVYVHGRLERSSLARLLTAAGLGFVVVGAIGAVLLGSVGPWLIEASTVDAAARVAARMQFASLENAVIVGLWGTLELPLLAVWLIGVNWVVRAEGRVFRWLGTVAGFGGLAYGIRTGLTGEPPIRTLVDVAILGGIGLLPIWCLWLAARLWRGR